MRRRTFLQSLALAPVVVGPDAGLLRAQPRVPRIGWLSPTSPGANPSLSNAFHEGLREHGWVDGQNIAIEYRWAEAKPERLPELAR